MFGFAPNSALPASDSDIQVISRKALSLLKSYFPTSMNKDVRNLENGILQKHAKKFIPVIIKY